MTEQRPSDGLAERLYESLYRIRRVEEEVARVYWTDVIKSPVHLSIGQEGASVAVCEALGPRDGVFGSYRGHALFLARGGDLRGMIAELYGKVTGVTKGKGGSMHLIDAARGVMGTSAVVASTIPEAVGYAFALRRRRSDAIAVAFFGDGATEEGVFYESLNFAALHKLPVMFVCENNFYAIHTPIGRRQSNTNIAERVRPFGIRAQQFNEDDVFALHSAACDAAASIRAGGGPQFLECHAYRWKEHVGPGEDYHVGYRGRDEAEPWMQRDPVTTVGARLEASVRAAIEERVECEVKDAFEFAEQSPLPDAHELYSDIYAHE